MRFRSAILVLGLAFASCTDVLPCSTCPTMEGPYTFTWATTTTNDSCPLPAAPPASVTFTRVGSSLRTALGSQELSGTLFDTYDFTLSGGLDTSYNLRGRLVTRGTGDAGVISLTGSLRTRLTDAKGGICDFDSKFTAAKR